MAVSAHLQLPGMTVTPSPFAPNEMPCSVCSQPHEWLVMRQTCCDAIAVCSRCLDSARSMAAPMMSRKRAGLARPPDSFRLRQLRSSRFPGNSPSSPVRCRCALWSGLSDGLRVGGHGTDTSMRRSDLLDLISNRVLAIERAHPVRIAIDGVDAAGKTTLAGELAGRLGDRGRSSALESTGSIVRGRFVIAEIRNRRTGTTWTRSTSKA